MRTLVVALLFVLAACSPRAASPLAVQPATLRPTRTNGPPASQTPWQSNTPDRLSTNTPRGLSATAAKVSYEDYTATGNANVRSCPQTTCDILTGLVLGQRVLKIGEAQGASVNGSALWYEINLGDGSTGYVHSGLVRFGTPRPAPVVVQPRATQQSNALAVATQPAGAATELPVTLPESFTSTPQPGSQFTCAGDLYNCGDFRNRTELMAYFNACPGDPSKLDGNNDGVPCESLR